MFNLPHSKRRFSTQFRCIACGHTFRRELGRIYVDGPTFEQRVIRQQETRHSEYIIPQRIICPRCQAVDQYEFTQYTRNMLSLTMTTSMLAGGLMEGHPVKIIAFALSNGQTVHPLDALEQYRQHVSTAPDDAGIRMRYANTLRTLGYFTEAKEEYTRILEQNPGQLEAWYNLAAIYVALKQKREAKKALLNFVEHAQQTSALNKAEAGWAQNVRHYLDGTWPLDELTPLAIFEAAPIRTSRLPGSKPKRRKR